MVPRTIDEWPGSGRVEGTAFGTAGEGDPHSIDVIHADAGEDLVDGGNDLRYVDNGNDLRDGGDGDELMPGSQLEDDPSLDTDTFAWSRDDVLLEGSARAGFDCIADFGAGDRLDFSGLLSSHRPVVAEHSIRATDTVAGTVLSVDMGGTAGFVDIVLLENVHGVDVHDLVSSGSVIV
jgi:hypothetical protein